MKYSFRQIVFHIIGILVFLSIPVLLSPDFGSFLQMIEIAGFQISFLNYIFLLIFFYLNYYVLIEKFYFQKRYFIYTCILIVFYLVITYLPFVFIHEEHLFKRPLFLHKNNMTPRGGNMPFYFLHIRSLMQFLAIFFLTLLLRIDEQLRSAKQEQLKAEVSYLKAQINPHFLFNTLNSLYALTISKSDSAPDAVLKLSNMMRYVVSESTNDFVSLEKEINYIKDYIDLQRLRIDKQQNLIVSITGNTSGKKITPLILIAFIENAFKYGINNEQKWRININIAITETQLLLDVENKKVKMSFPEIHVSEKGIENTQKRLNFIYPNQHELIIDETPETFQVHLKINLL